MKQQRQNTGIKYASILLFGLILFTSLGGCRHQPAAAESPPLCRVVTEITVAYRQGTQAIQRHYTSPEKMHLFLNYLRILERSRVPETIPAPVGGESYQITVCYSDGQHTVYHQQADSFLSIDGGAWAKIDPEHAATLRQLLEDIPGDLP